MTPSAHPTQPAAYLLEMIDYAESRGIRVVELDADEWMVMMRGALTIVDGTADLRVLLKRMGVAVDCESDADGAAA